MIIYLLTYMYSYKKILYRHIHTYKCTYSVFLHRSPDANEPPSRLVTSMTIQIIL